MKYNRLDSEKFNTGKQMEMDLAKVIALALMIIIHVFGETYDGESGFFYLLIYEYLDHFICAATFMFCMGACMHFTSKNSSLDFAKRGGLLILVGFQLNIFRYLIPFTFAYAVTGDLKFIVSYMYVITVDILPFAGLSFLLIALFVKLKLQPMHIFLISIPLNVLGCMMQYVQTGNYVINTCIGFFWGTHSDSYFPLFNWFMFVAAGYLFGDIIQRVKNKKRFYVNWIIIGFIALAIDLIYNYYFFDPSMAFFDDEIYYAWMNTINAFLICGFNFGWMGICYFIIRDRRNRVIEEASSNINTIYCVSWVIIMWMYALMEMGWLPWITTELAIFIVFIFTTAVTYAAMKLSHTKAIARFHKSIMSSIWIRTIIVAVIIIATVAVCVYVHDTYVPDMNYPNLVDEYEFY